MNNNWQRKKTDVRQQLLSMAGIILSLIFPGQVAQAGGCTPLGPFGLPGLTDSPDQIGQWSTVYAWPNIATHASVLENGKVLWWRSGEPITPYLFDPITNTNSTTAPVSTNMFCAGHASMADGSIFVSGGTVDFTDNMGSLENNIYSPASSTWTPAALLNYARWYPTVTALPDGRMLVSGGTITPYPSVTFALVPEIYDPTTNTWTALESAAMNLERYPYMFVLPNGGVLHAGPIAPTKILDTKAGTWQTVTASRHTGIQGSAVMYRPGKVMRMGGGDPATADTEVLEMDITPQDWVETTPMQYARRRPDLVLMPDGNTVVIGGSTATQTDPNCAVHAAEIWDANTKSWTTMASMERARLYHSVAVLLPDGRILAAGGDHLVTTDYGYNAEIYSPPYLFKGARPSITSAPSILNYGSSFDIEVDDREAIASISIMRPGSTTHNFDENQRYVPLNYSAGAGPNTIQISAPANANLAPPGTYMLFVVNDLGVPSEASFLSINLGIDSDVDGVLDSVDNCTLVANASQLDTNADGYGNACDPDLNNDGIVNFADIILWVPFFNTAGNGDADFDGNGVVNFGDFILFNNYFLLPPGPSAVAP